MKKSSGTIFNAAKPRPRRDEARDEPTHDPDSTQVKRLSDLPQEIPPPHDGWPALEARLREDAMPPSGRFLGRQGREVPPWRRRPRIRQAAALAALLGAVVVGMSIDRWVLPATHPARQVAAAPRTGAPRAEIPVGYISDPHYLRARAALLRSLDARLAALPSPTRQKVLTSLAVIHQSMRQVRRALGRQPGNALLQELLIETYQDEMQLLSTVQDTSGAGGETRT